MTEALPEPLVAPEVDLRDFGFLPLDALRLRDSALAASSTGNEFKAAVLLWCVAWHQIPAASLPDDDRFLASKSGAGSGWKRVKDVALRGFVKCSDGRLYHRILAEKANEAWAKKQGHRAKTRAANEARERAKAERERQRNIERDVERDGQRDDSNNSERDVLLGTGKGQGEVRDTKNLLGGELSAGAGANAVEVIADFDRIRVEVFGEMQARPNPHATDLVHAQRFLATGASRELIAAVFDEAQRRRHGTGQRPIDGLAYPGFERAIADAVATAARPITPGQATTKPPGRGFIKPRIT